MRHYFIFPCICSFFFHTTFFVKDISTTAYERNFIFGIHVANDKLYSRVENRPSPMFFFLFLYLLLFLFLLAVSTFLFLFLFCFFF